MSWSGLIKFTLGFALAIALLFFAGVNASRYFIARFTTPPPKPIFPNDRPSPASPQKQGSPSPKPDVTPTRSPSSQPTTSPTPSPLPSGAYEGEVTEPIGLIIRQTPNREAEQVGGVAYNERVTVLDTSPDGEWVRIRLSSADIEGWVKSGNVTRVN